MDAMSSMFTTHLNLKVPCLRARGYPSMTPVVGTKACPVPKVPKKNGPVVKKKCQSTSEGQLGKKIKKVEKKERVPGRDVVRGYSASQATPLWGDLMVQRAGGQGSSPDRQHPPLQCGLGDLLNLVQST